MGRMQRKVRQDKARARAELEQGRAAQGVKATELLQLRMCALMRSGMRGERGCYASKGHTRAEPVAVLSSWLRLVP